MIVCGFEGISKQLSNATDKEAELSASSLRTYERKRNLLSEYLIDSYPP